MVGVKPGVNLGLVEVMPSCERGRNVSPKSSKPSTVKHRLRARQSPNDVVDLEVVHTNDAHFVANQLLESKQ